MTTGVVLARTGGTFRVHTAAGEIEAVLRGKLKHKDDDRVVGALALPKDGDFLAVTPEGTERKIAVREVPLGKRSQKGQKVVKRGGIASLRRADEVG